MVTHVLQQRDDVVLDELKDGNDSALARLRKTLAAARQRTTFLGGGRRGGLFHGKSLLSIAKLNN